jgi:hypothetical protein
VLLQYRMISLSERCECVVYACGVAKGATHARRLAFEGYERSWRGQAGSASTRSVGSYAGQGGVSIYKCMEAAAPRRPMAGAGDSSPGTVDVDPHLTLAPPVSRHPPTPGAAGDPAAGHPYISAALPAPVAVGPDIAVRPRRRWPAIMPRCGRREARAIGMWWPAGARRRSGRPIPGRCGLGRGGAQPTAGGGDGGGQSDGAQQRTPIHGESSI